MAPDYTASTTAYDFTDISATGRNLQVNSYNPRIVAMPFAINLYGQVSNDITVCNSGSFASEHMGRATTR